MEQTYLRLSLCIKALAVLAGCQLRSSAAVCADDARHHARVAMDQIPHGAGITAVERCEARLRTAAAHQWGFDVPDAWPFAHTADRDVLYRDYAV